MQPENKIFCEKPWQGLLIFAGGEVRFCCYIKKELGNLNFQTFLGIWNGAVAKKIRKKILAGEIPEECRMCPMAEKIKKG